MEGDMIKERRAEDGEEGPTPITGGILPAPFPKADPNRTRALQMAQDRQAGGKRNKKGHGDTPSPLRHFVVQAWCRRGTGRRAPTIYAIMERIASR
jgi:hypothetical protein